MIVQITVNTVTAGAVATFTVTGTAVNTQTYTNVNKAYRTGVGLSVDVELTVWNIHSNIEQCRFMDTMLTHPFTIPGTTLFGATPNK